MQYFATIKRFFVFLNSILLFLEAVISVMYRCEASREEGLESGRIRYFVAINIFKLAYDF
ncbi:hypothetical protein CWB72_19080 [Pseudoalteromonas phenolica]|nr:hypothetical protein CWB72_19080 [Pseudoalteromonas phenolica]